MTSKVTFRDGGGTPAHGINSGFRVFAGGFKDRRVLLYRAADPGFHGSVQAGKLRALLDGKSHAALHVFRQSRFFRQIHRGM